MTHGHNNALGDFGQHRAERHLVAQGMVVLDRNWRCHQGELDLVLQDGQTLVACEVKTRTDTRFGHPLAAITPEKFDRLRRLIENFITLVELQTDEAYKTFVWRKAPVESLEAVVQAAWKHNNLFEETTHQLIVETMKNIPTFIGDEIYLRVAVAQLLSNAVKFSPSHYPITVGAVVEGNYVRLWVKDRGRGIPTRELARIWESFYQVDRAEYEAIEKLHKRSCDVVTAHDQSSAKAATIPTATDLGNDIAALKAIVETIKNRRAATKTSV